MEYPAAPAGSGGYKYYYPPQHAQPQALRRPPRPAARWVKQWIPQDLAFSGGKCSLFKWVREDGHRSSKENSEVLDVEAPKPEPTTEILFLCSYENCGKTFVDVSALRKHAHVHNERQYICTEPNCGKTGTPVAVQHTPPAEKPHSTPKPSTPATTSYTDRPYVCPYEGCDKAYIHSYKLNLHLKTQHPEHGQEENGKLGTSTGQHGVNEPAYPYNYAEIGDAAPNPKRSKTHKVHSSKAYNSKIPSAMPSSISGVKNQWSGKATYEDDSEETEDGGNNIEDGWRYGSNADDEETQDED
nr:unnamed protein product [Digitaria exilis]